METNPPVTPSPAGVGVGRSAARSDLPPTWRYLDVAQTHELHVSVRQGPPLVFHVREVAVGHEDPEEVLESQRVLRDVGAAARAHQTLETRLALMGRYFRLAAGSSQWTPVQVTAPLRPFDLAEVDLGPALADVRVHVYGAMGAVDAVALLDVPYPTSSGRRHLVVRLDTELHVLHTRLPPRLARSLLARLHMEFLEQRLQPVPTLGPHRFEEAERAAALAERVCEALDRLDSHPAASPLALAWREGPPPLPHGPLGPVPGERQGAHWAARPGLRRPEARPGRLVPLGATWASRDRAYEIEDPDPAPARPGPDASGGPTIEERSLDLAEALRDPRILGLHGRFLKPGEDARLMREGELAITAHVKAVREASPPAVQHLISILEASLLVRYALLQRRRIDPRLSDLLKRSLVYLDEER